MLNKTTAGFGATLAFVASVGTASAQDFPKDWETRFNNEMNEACDPIVDDVLSGSFSATSAEIDNCTDRYWNTVMFYADQARIHGLMGAWSDLNTGYCSGFTRNSDADTLQSLLYSDREKANNHAQNGFQCMTEMGTQIGNDLLSIGVDGAKYDEALSVPFCLAAASRVLSGRSQELEVKGCRRTQEQLKRGGNFTQGIRL